MSHTFTYEINESDLRKQIKNFSLPGREDAWRKFEAYAYTVKEQSFETRLKQFNFSLNRAVVLPVVFGLIIIIFSFLLVNFITIKNPSRATPETENTAVKNVAPVVTQHPKPEKQKVNEVVHVKQDSIPHREQEAVKLQEPEENQPVVQEAVTEKKTPALIEPIVSDHTSADTIVGEETKNKKKNKKRSDISETQKLEEIKPTPILEEQDSEIVPEQSH